VWTPAGSFKQIGVGPDGTRVAALFPANKDHHAVSSSTTIENTIDFWRNEIKLVTDHTAVVYSDYHRRDSNRLTADSIHQIIDNRCCWLRERRGVISYTRAKATNLKKRGEATTKAAKGEKGHVNHTNNYNVFAIRCTNNA
jgi:hypothetical protein